MTPTSSARRIARFGPFSLDLATGEIRRAGGRVRLQDMPFRVLEQLVHRAGDLVTREELRDSLWGVGTHVDFEHGLNAAVHKLRVALRDPARRGRIIETLPGRGYRLAGTVSFAASRASGDAESELAIQARMQLARRSADGILAAIDTFSRLATERPNHADAHGGLARATNLALDWGIVPEGVGFARSEEACRRALAIDADHSEANAELGFVRHRRDWDGAGAEECYRRAIRPASANAHSYQRFAEFLSQHGRHAEAQRMIAHARATNPESTLLAAIEAWILYHARNYPAARAACGAILKFDRDLPLARYVLGRVELAEGRTGPATSELTAATAGFGSNPFAQVGLEIARARAEDTSGPPLPSGISPYLTAKLHLARGHRERALSDLESAAEQHCGWVVDIGVDPELDALRGEPRFREVRSAVGV